MKKCVAKYTGKKTSRGGKIYDVNGHKVIKESWRYDGPPLDASIPKQKRKK